MASSSVYFKNFYTNAICWFWAAYLLQFFFYKQFRRVSCNGGKSRTINWWTFFFGIALKSSILLRGDSGPFGTNGKIWKKIFFRLVTNRDRIYKRIRLNFWFYFNIARQKNLWNPYAYFIYEKIISVSGMFKKISSNRMTSRSIVAATPEDLILEDKSASQNFSFVDFKNLSGIQRSPIDQILHP